MRQWQHPVVPEIAGPFDELSLGARIVQQHIGNRSALLLGCLCLDPRAGVGLVHPPLDQPLDSYFFVGGHHHHKRKHRRHPGFHQQRDVLDHNGVVVHRVDDLLASLPDERVHDAIQLGALLVVDERLGGQRGPVQRAVGQQNVLAEGVDQLASPSVPGSTTSRAMTSPSTMMPPHSSNMADTVDLPAPIPPVRPIRSIRAVPA